MMLDYPILGVGFGRFLDVVALHPDKYPTRFNPHNAYIMLGAEGGVGLLLIGIALAFFILIGIYRAFKSTQSTQGRIILAGILAGSTGFLLQNLTNDLLYLPHLTTYFWFFYALAMNVPDNWKQQEESDFNRLGSIGVTDGL
jgi:O-antigen ligase